MKNPIPKKIANKLVNKRKTFQRRDEKEYPFIKEKLDLSTLVYLGYIERIIYYSDKSVYKGETKKPVLRRHDHKFKQKLHVYTNPKGTALIIRGTKISGRGILN